MNKLISKLVAGAVSGGLLLGSFATSAFAGDLVIEGNGNNSNNTITVTTIGTCVIGQQNTTQVQAQVTTKASTGKNTVSGNTGAGDIKIDTGDATATSTVTVTGGNNTITDPCCCNAVPPVGDKKIKDNGNSSTNDIVVVDSTTSTIGQVGATGVGVAMKTKARTGRNKVKNNTGTGDKTVLTGNSTSESTLEVTGGSNSL